MLTGLNHLTLAISSLPRSVDFYQHVLGFRLCARWKTGAYLSLDDLWLCLSLDAVRSTLVGRDYTHYAFTIDAIHFADFAVRLFDQGVTLWKEDTSEGESLYFLDPDGHQLEAHVGTLSSRLAACRAHPYEGMEFFD